MSYEFRGTPGPWKYSPGRLTRVYGNGFAVCELSGGEAVRDKRNAQLIAAGPSLLYELSETHAALCMKDPEYIGSERYNRNRAALAKATGQDQ